MRSRQSWLILLAVSCLCAPHAAAQVLYGSLVGTVTDPTAAVIPNAIISITHQGTGQARSIGADAEGRYAFQNVQAGSMS